MDTKSALPELTVGYRSKNPFIKNLFWKRIQIAIDFARIDYHSRILDLGCQSGHLLETIRNFNSQCQCWGTDIEPRIMTLKIPNCTFRIGDATCLPFPDSYFTVVFVLDILEHINDIQSVEVAIKEIQRVLVPNGHAILSGPTESRFYKLCRFIQFGRLKVDYHFHTIYDIEEKFVAGRFKKLKSKSLPGIPFPTLFRVTKFEK